MGPALWREETTPVRWEAWKGNTRPGRNTSAAPRKEDWTSVSRHLAVDALPPALPRSCAANNPLTEGWLEKP